MLTWRNGRNRCDGQSWRRWQGAPLRLAAALGLALMLGMGLAGCRGPLNFEQLTGASSNAPNNRVTMGIASFYPTKVTINAGQSVVFTDPKTSGGVHYICVGTGLKCKPIPGTPALLAQPSGLFFQNDAPPVAVQFNTPGDYSVICTIHPGMTMHVEVK